MAGRHILLAATLVAATLLGCHAAPEGVCKSSTLIGTGTLTGTVIASIPGASFTQCCEACAANWRCLCIEFGEEGVCKLFLDPTQTLLDAPNNHTIVFFGGRVTADPVVTMFNGEKLYWSAPKSVPHNMLSAPGFAINAVIGDFTDSAGIVGVGEHNNEWLVAIGARFAQSTLEITMDTSANVAMFTDDAGVIRMRLEEGSITDLLRVKIDGEDASHMLGNGATIQAGNATIYFPSSSSIVGVVAVLRTEQFEVTIYNEDAASFHLDFGVTMFSAVDSAAMHGVLGQSWAWRKDSQVVTHAIAGEAQDYQTDGLTGTDFKYSTFNVASPSKGRKMLDMHAGVVVASAGYGI